MTLGTEYLKSARHRFYQDTLAVDTVDTLKKRYKRFAEGPNGDDTEVWSDAENVCFANATLSVSNN